MATDTYVSEAQTVSPDARRAPSSIHRWRLLALASAVLSALVLSTAATASPEARRLTYKIGVYERSVAVAIDAHWRNTGTKCEFRSGRTLVYCMTLSNKWGQIQSTMRRISATRLRVVIKFLDEGPSRTLTIPGK